MGLAPLLLKSAIVDPACKTLKVHCTIHLRLSPREDDFKPSFDGPKKLDADSTKET